MFPPRQSPRGEHSLSGLQPAQLVVRLVEPPGERLLPRRKETGDDGGERDDEDGKADDREKRDFQWLIVEQLADGYGEDRSHNEAGNNTC